MTNALLPCADLGRQQLRDLIKGGRARDAVVIVPTIAALVAKWGLAAVDGTTFGLFSNPAGDTFCAITSGSAVLTSANNPWLPTDVGRVIDVQGAGPAGATLRTSILSYQSAGQVTLATAAGTTVAPSFTSAAGLAVWGELIVGGGSASAAQLASSFPGVYSVKDFGAKVDGTTDDTNAVQACIDYVSSLNGGTVYIPNGTCKISATLLIIKSNVNLRGAGGDTYHDGGTGVTPATKIQWAGGAVPVIQIKTPAGGVGSVITGSGVQSLGIDGNGAATYGIDLFTIRAGIFENLFVANVVTSSYHVSCGVTGTYSPEACDVQYCRFSRCTWRNIDSAGVQGASGFILDGSSNANTSLNVFENCTGQTWAAVATSCGFLLPCADNNVFLRCGVTRINTTGAAVQVNGVLSDANHFFNCTFGGANGIQIKGTASGYSGNSVRCSFWGMDNANSTLPPTYDAGCTAAFHLDTGGNYRHRVVQGAASDTNVALQAAMTAIGSASWVIDNGSNNHLLFSVGGAAAVWGVNIDGSGNIRFGRLTGNGIVNIGNGVDFMAGTMRITYGTAPPAAGTWAKGDKCWQTQPTVGNPKAWQCTVAGTPGTWVSEGNL